MTTDKSILYSSVRSPHCLKVAMFLAEKGVSFERVEIDLPVLEQRTPEFLAINPLGLVPVYEDDRGIHCDSLYIMQYLESRYAEPKLFPTEPDQLAKALQWIEHSSTDVRDVSHHLYWQLIEPPETGTDKVRVDVLKQRGMEILHNLESILSQSTYVMGNLSVVDIAMIPWIYGYQRFDFPFEQDFPHVRKWLNSLSERPAFQSNYRKVGRPFFVESP